MIGITGSNGKTTTTTLTGELMRAAGADVIVGGNIGTPLTSLDRKVERHDLDRGRAFELSTGDDSKPARECRGRNQHHARSPGPARLVGKLRPRQAQDFYEPGPKGLGRAQRR